ncbi:MULTISPECIES: HAD family hydrolase [unclassified Pseudoclavibacter]|uniref:HAD family hydrolase n=1 Tax=unclassified Pseudoclavibacter TaxID=2615177 RepID=UPI0015C97EC1|nr:MULTISPECIES: HAD family phosphatase [unclassified Pseudoclavibacter]MBS3178053.1 HAD family phosphatase [Pseudoclavibacter sp. Marseille-Q4354]NYF13756.1 HAD superfamily hydrolase (TIGR01509 family) [Pseudoclavibacter sp. JAI123]
MAPSNLPDAVLWDMDGTIVDTEQYWQTAQLNLLADHGLPPLTEEQELGMVGSSMADASEFFARLGVDLAPGEIVDHMNSTVMASILAELAWRPGALDLLGALHAAGVPNALVTNSTRVLADAVVSTLDTPLFAIVIAGDEVENGKPHPEPYLRAAAQLGVAPERCVAVEDSRRGLEAARAAGCATIGIPHGQTLEAHHAHLVTATLEGITPEALGELVEQVARETTQRENAHTAADAAPAESEAQL